MGLNTVRLFTPDANPVGKKNQTLNFFPTRQGLNYPNKVFSNK